MAFKRYIRRRKVKRKSKSLQVAFILFAFCVASLYGVYGVSIYFKEVDTSQKAFYQAPSNSHVLKASTTDQENIHVHNVTSLGFQKVDPSQIEIDRAPNKSVLLNASSLTREKIHVHNVRHDLGLQKKNTSTSIITILLINKPVWFSLRDPFYDCPYTNCRMTELVENIKSKSAIVFSIQDELTVSLKPRDKSKDQVWIFLRMEPPPVNEQVQWFEDPVWRNTMNWSWSYRLDSDIVRPYSKFIPRSPLPVRDYSKIFKRKNKVAAWVVSNCRTQSRREEYVQQLKQHGLPVDIYGRCSPNGEREPQVEKKVNDNYKFYLSFENSFCKDYVTEKFFLYYELDVVIVARGGFNYTRYFDETTFINAADFPSAKELADFILKVNSDEVLFTNYLRNKDKYEPMSMGYSNRMSNCQLCEKLNKKERYNKVHEDMSASLFKDACRPPNDL